MNFLKFLPVSRPAAFLVAALVASGCNTDDGLAPENPGTVPPSTEPLSVGLEASSLTGEAGSRITLAVVAESKARSPLITLQGYVRFDPSRLQYAGQKVEPGAMAMLNASAAARGEIRLVALKLPQLNRQAATLVFEVKAADYARGLSFALEEGSTAEGDQLTSANLLPLSSAAISEPVEARQMAVADWTKHLAAAGYATEPSGKASVMAFTPGAGTRYGDVNLSNTITNGDVTYLGNVTVGNTTLADPATNRDGVLAGNVTPNNGGDGILVGFGDPCRPGVACTSGAETGPGDITGADLGQIAQEAVGTNRPVVGEVIPGRATPSGTINIAAGVYNAADCGPVVPCTWTRNNVYRLNGIVQFGGGANLVIEEGTRIEGNTTINPNGLYIRRDATIQAIGSALAPIVFSCTGTKTRGCWGGLAIAGNAPVNLQQAGAPAAPASARNPGGGGNTRILEGPAGGQALDFGGNNAGDNSGTLKYVRIEYAGFIVGTNNELNGLTMGGVGSGTTVDYVQVHAGLDDGYELFGGTVNAEHLYLTANSDDSYDWSFGWAGRAQYVIIQQDSLDADKALEGDNSEGTGATFNETPRTDGPLYNFTMVGAADPLSPSGNIIGGVPNNVNDAVHIRRGNRSVVGNSIIASFPVVLDLDDAATCSGAASDPKVLNTTLISNSAQGNSDGSDPACQTGATEAAVLSGNSNTVVASLSGQLVRPFDVMSPDFRPISGSTTATGATATVPAGLDQTSYRGAVPAAVSVTQNNISWYMGWTRGWSSPTTP